MTNLEVFEKRGNEKLSEMTIRNRRCGDAVITVIKKNIPSSIEEIRHWLGKHAFFWPHNEFLHITISYEDENFVRDFLMRSNG